MPGQEQRQGRAFEQGERAASGDKVNINTAGREELRRIYRIGDDLADEIIRYRDDHGPFKRTEDLQKVPGVGPDLLRDAGEQMTV